jgi:hypothetical protein
MKVPAKMQWVSFGALVAAAGPTSSTAGLIWLFLPICLAVGAAFAWPLLYVVLKARRRLQ